VTGQDKYDTFLAAWLDHWFGQDAGIAILVASIALCGVAYHFFNPARWADKKDTDR
jgi:hypothetical protein